VAVALSIGAVKSIIVALYFMQLRYDTPVNALVGVFTIMILTFFLGFTMIDLGNRGLIDEYKGKQIVAGGIGDISRGTGVWTTDPVTGKSTEVLETIPAGTSIAEFARQKADRLIEESLSKGERISSHAYQMRLVIHHNELAALPAVPADKAELFHKMHAYIQAHAHDADFEHVLHEVAAHSHGHGEAVDHHAESTPNLSRTRTGLTPGLFDDTPAAPAHGDKPAPHGH
jgi:hypothetical protein